MKLRPIHPFPARMAPEIVLDECLSLPEGAAVLDPMAGSGTVLRVAAEQGHRAVGCDSDPLAVLISKAWTAQVDAGDVLSAARELAGEAEQLSDQATILPWMQDSETRSFIQFWFAEPQISDLTRLASCLSKRADDVSDILRVCLSRLIITKERGASLARDVSHSRPHKVRSSNDFPTMKEFLRIAQNVAGCLAATPILRAASVSMGDARDLTHLNDNEFDAIITSPPYLNAIDYMRAHRMALVWLGYSIPQLRAIRSSAVGTERAPDDESSLSPVVAKVQALNWYSELPKRETGLVRRYTHDICALMNEIHRVMKKSGKAILVVGNSCLRGTYIENSHIIEIAAENAGLLCKHVYTRELPLSRRYLPLPSSLSADLLAKRMRKECVLTFAKA